MPKRAPRFFVVWLLASLTVMCQCASAPARDRSATSRLIPHPVSGAAPAVASRHPSAAQLEAPNETASSETRLVLGRGAAGGLSPAFSEQAKSPDPPAKTTEPQARVGTNVLGAWTRTAGEVGAAAGWALGRFVRSGNWGGRTATVFDRDSSSNDTGAGSFEAARTALRAQASIRNAGLVLGPRLLIGNLGVDVTLAQEAFRVNRSVSPGTGKFAGYDAGITVLPDRAVSAAFFATSTRNLSPRLFGTARDRRTRRHGTSIRFRAPWMTSAMNWTDESFESRARTDDATLREGEAGRTFEFTGSGTSARQPVSFEYRRERRTDLVFPRLSFPVETATLRYGLELDPVERGRNVTSTLGLNRRGGDLRRDLLWADTRLNYRVSPALDARGSYRLERTEASTLERNGQRADVQLQHRLYESLFTTVTIRGSLDEFQTGRRDLYGGRLQVGYRKRLAGGGRLSANIGRDYDRAANRFSGREEVILGEAQTVRLGAPVRLDVARVVPGTIVISDPTQSIIFQEGFDYTVTIVGDFAEVGLLAGGRMRDGGTVTVDYRVTVSPFTSTSTSRPVFDLAVDYGWISSYISVHRVSRKLLSGLDDGSVFDQKSRTAGVRLRGSRRNLQVAGNADHRTERAQNLSFRTLHLGQVMSYSFGASRVLNVDVSRVVTRFHVPDRRETLGSGRVDFQWRATEILSVDAVWLARRRRDSLGFDEDYYQAGLDARWQGQAFELFASVGRNWGARAGQPFGGLRVSIGMARSFS